MRSIIDNFRAVSALLIIALGASASLAQSKPAAAPKVVSGGVLNGKAISLPKPVYPPDARRAGITGKVSVKVLINETGMVISAAAVSGPQSASLRQSSEAAAMQATFSPTLLSGRPVKVSGVITYNFVAETNEEKLKVMGISTFLGIARHFTSDWNTFQVIFEGDEMFRDGATESPEFAEALKSLDSLGGMTPEKRVETIDKALLSIRSKLDPSESWQFTAGSELANVIGSLMRLVGPDGQPDVSRIDEPGLKVTLGRIADLTLSAPADFPPDVLARMKEFAALRSKDIFATEADFQEFRKRMEALLNTISPDDGK